MAGYRDLTDEELAQFRAGPGTATAPGMSLSAPLAVEGYRPFDPATEQMRPETIPAPPGAPPTPQLEGWGRYPAIAGTALAKGALSATGILGDLQNFLQGQADQRIIDPIRHAVGLRDPVTPRTLTGQEQFYPGAGGQSLQNLFPGATPEQLPDYLQANRRELGRAPDPTSRMASGQFVQLGQQLGAVDRPELKPQNAGERYTAAVGEGVGGALPFLPLTAGAAIPNAIRGIVQGAAAGAGGELASEFSDSPWVRAGGAVAGALGAGGALNAGGKIANAARGVNSPVVQAYDRLGIDPALAGDVTGNTFMRQLQAYSSTAPGGAGRLVETSNRNLTQFGNAADRAAATLGTARTADEAGTALGMSERAWANNFQQGQRNIWGNVDMHLPQTTQAPLTNYANTLNAVAQEIPNLPSTARRLQDPLSRGLLEDLITDIQAGGVPTVRDLRGIRTRIGDRLGEPVISADTNRAELQRLWGALSQDIEQLVATRGPAAQQAFADASAYSRNGHQFIDRVLSKIAQGTDERPTALFGAPAAERALQMGQKSGQFMEALRTEMPDAANELAAYRLRQMVSPRPGQNELVPASPSRYLTETAPDKLSPRSRDALFGQVAPVLDDLTTVAGRMRRTEPFVNRSLTTPTSQLGQTLTGLIPWLTSALGAGGGAYGGGLGGAALGAAAGLGPFAVNRGVAQLSSMPAFNRAIAAPSALPATAGSGLIAGGGLYPQLRGLLAP